MNIEKLLKDLTLDEKASLCSGSSFWHTQAVDRLGIPKVMVCDGPNGLRKQDGAEDHLGINKSIPAVCFPTSSAVAASFDRELAHRIGEVLGEECKAENVSMLLGPGVNIKRSPLCGRNFEYYSEDPYISSQMASAYIKGIQSKNVGACMKHFAANNQETHRMNGNSIVDERTFHELYLASFEGAVKEAKPAGVMCAYNKVNDVYAAENKKLLNDILREKWGYEGFVVTDWGAAKDRVKGIIAGLDLEMPGGLGAVANDKKIVKAVESGELPIEVLDKTVTRILEFISGAISNSEQEAIFDRERDYEEAVKAAKECAVLLKNNNSILPLKEGSKIAFIGAFAEKPRYQGSGSSYINSAKVTSALKIASNLNNISYSKGFELETDETNEQLLLDAVEQAKQADYAVIFAGLPNVYETEGLDRKHLNLPENQNKLISDICKVQPNVIVVLHNGAPVVMPWVGEVPAILEMYLAGDGVGEATISLLFGNTNPSGKLAETFPLRLEDNPSYLNFPGVKGIVEYHEGIFVGYRYYDKKKMDVLFPFGHGLSYSEFEYNEIRINKEKITDGETVQVTVKVKNVGECAGKEVVQLYISDVDSTVGRPIRELKGFEKISLMPGEEKTVIFTLDKKAFAYYETSINDWYVESGEFLIEIGSSSRDIRGKVSVAVESTVRMKVIFDKDSTVGDLMNNPKGQAVIHTLMQAGGQVNQEAALGEGSVEMAKSMMVEMPLGSLVSFGVMSEEQLDGLITLLNEG